MDQTMTVGKPCVVLMVEMAAWLLVLVLLCSIRWVVVVIISFGLFSKFQDAATNSNSVDFTHILQ